MLLSSWCNSVPIVISESWLHRHIIWHSALIMARQQTTWGNTLLASVSAHGTQKCIDASSLLFINSNFLAHITILIIKYSISISSRYFSYFNRISLCSKSSIVASYSLILSILISYSLIVSCISNNVLLYLCFIQCSTCIYNVNSSSFCLSISLSASTYFRRLKIVCYWLSLSVFSLLFDLYKQFITYWLLGVDEFCIYSQICKFSDIKSYFSLRKS